jgi:hypothetical protein
MNNIKPRDYFASQAMQVLLNKFDPEKYNVFAIVKDSYAIADAMVVEAAK